jgi:hypothetical protein
MNHLVSEKTCTQEWIMNCYSNRFLDLSILLTIGVAHYGNPCTITEKIADIHLVHILYAKMRCGLKSFGKARKCHRCFSWYLFSLIFA